MPNYPTTPFIRTYSVKRQHKIFLNDKHNKFTFGNLDTLSKQLSSDLLNSLNTNDLQGAKIAVYCSSNYTYLISLLAIWHSNGVPVCLSKLYPLNYLEYFLNDSKCKLVINGFGLDDQPKDEMSLSLRKKNVYNYKLNEDSFFLNMKEGNHEADSSVNPIDLNNFDSKKEALILYTSGTSGPPKGVVLTFKNIVSSMQTMRDAWQWSDTDCMLATLPLNHYSGLVYCLLTPFYIGAQVNLMPKFNAELVWSKLLDETNNINMFIGVPTIFSQLIDYSSNKAMTNSVSAILRRKLRIIGSGSAPLNVKTYNDWFELTDYKILERYGMTEIGMALTNPFIETKHSRIVAGTVGRPVGEIKVRLFDEISSRIQVVSDAENDFFHNQALESERQIFGELQVSGPIVFREYLNKNEQTRDCFTEDGWFKTGDTAQFLKENKIYKIIGRTTVDVIKSGGYKISALDIEKELLSHPDIEDVAVMGMQDAVWGQRVFSLIVLKDGRQDEFDEDGFKRWCAERLPKYSVPTVIRFVDKMPRNIMGKVNKKEVIKEYENNNSEN